MAARPLRAGVGAALLAGTAVLANWPLRVDDGRVEERTRMALWLIGQERYAEAETRLTGLARDHAEPALLHFRAGRAYLAKGQPEPAVRHLEQSRAADAGRPETDYALGQALLDAQRAKEAIPHLRRAFDAGVRPDLVGYDLARAYGAAGDRANAVRVLQRVRPARRDDADSWRLLGELALALEAPRLSEAFLRQSLEARPDSAPVYEQLGLAVALSGRYEEAIRSFERSVQLDPANASAQLNLAVAYAEVGRTREARARAQESLRLNPGYDKARTFLEAIKNK
jgi:tetratricopeptide (TPR) repeat protein